MPRVARLVSREDGQAIVEFALALPIFVLLLLGLLQFGFVLNAKQQLEGVARQGARTFALTGDFDAALTAIRVSGRQLPGFATRTTLAFEVAPPGRRHAARHLSVEGPLAAVTLPGGHARRGSWVRVSVTYAYANPVQATVLGRRVLPAAISLTTRAVARTEVDRR